LTTELVVRVVAVEAEQTAMTDLALVQSTAAACLKYRIASSLAAPIKKEVVGLVFGRIS
jgi:hypothetical protein